MKVLQLYGKALMLSCALGIVTSAGIFCQKKQSAKNETSAAAVQAVNDSMATANKTATADTSMKKRETIAVSTWPDSAAMVKTGYYTCPMHPQIHQSKPGKCPICGMKLVYKKPAKAAGKTKNTNHAMP